MATTMRHLLVLGTLLALTSANSALAAAAVAAKTKTKTNTLPSACLRDATSLCQGATTNSLTCLMQLAKAGDARVSKACSTALPAFPLGLKSGATSSRVDRLLDLQRLLTEDPASATGATANCVGTKITGTVTSPSHQTAVGFTSCGNVCCRWANTAGGACCMSNPTMGAGCIGAALCAFAQ